MVLIFCSPEADPKWKIQTQIVYLEGDSRKHLVKDGGWGRQG